jgi:hypothetical protein
LEKIQLVKNASYESKQWHNPKTLFDLPTYTLQIATFQELGVPYALTNIVICLVTWLWLSHRGINK